VFATPAGALSLSKHEGAGNDFLVILDPTGDLRLDGADVRALCERHRGVGADGVIRVSPGRAGADLSMELRNADGGLAEMSGNGIRCLAQAAVDAGLVTPPVFSVATAAGTKTVTYLPGERPGRARASVDMGPVALGAEVPPPAGVERARLVDVGNPHLVLLVDDAAALDGSVLDVAGVGARLEAGHPGGINVEWIAPGPGPDELVLRVWERGAGETLACGTGSCAAAAAARAWGLVGSRVAVHNPGGTLEVTLAADATEPVVLAGPVHKVADLTVELDRLR